MSQIIYQVPYRTNGTLARYEAPTPGILERVATWVRDFVDMLLGRRETRRVRERRQALRYEVEDQLYLFEQRRRLAIAAMRAEEAEAQYRVRQQLLTLPLPQARALAAKEIERQKLLLRYEEQLLARERLFSGQSAQATSTYAAAASRPAVDVDLSDQEVEALATRTAIHLSSLPAAQLPAAQRELYDELLRRQISPYRASEVTRRAQELLGYAR